MSFHEHFLSGSWELTNAEPNYEVASSGPFSSSPNPAARHVEESPPSLRFFCITHCLETYLACIIPATLPGQRKKPSLAGHVGMRSGRQ